VEYVYAKRINKLEVPIYGEAPDRENNVSSWKPVVVDAIQNKSQKDPLR
jgi:hypothetical protein